MVSDDTIMDGGRHLPDTRTRIESEIEVQAYLQDLRFPKRSEMREFGKVYNGKGDVYIKIRVELLSEYGNHTTFIMSFHYAEIPFTPQMFPYKKKGRANP